MMLFHYLPKWIGLLIGFAAVAAIGEIRASHAADGAKGDVFQIVKATGDRVWRLNKTTGEIAVCTLEADNLICTTSAEAVRPPSKTFEEREAEKERARDEAAKRREQERLRDLEFFDRVLAAFRLIVGAAMERDAAADAAGN